MVDGKRIGIKQAVAGKEKVSAWHKVKQDLLKPRQLSRKEIISRKKLREQKIAAKHQLLSNYLQKAGIGMMPEVVSGRLLKACIIINALIAVYLVFRLSSFFRFGALYVTFLIILAWAAAFLLVLFVIWFVFFLSIDVLIYKRRVKLEKVLPDFLLLASANIRAGMPIDRALWYAVRPRFGVLAREIELVAKETMSGEDLESALNKFAAKYDSIMLKNTVNLLTESINAGGEIGGLLNKISANIQENEMLKKEMAAGISAYAIFIGAATLAVAPILFALSSQLLTVITSISSSIKLPAVSMPLFSLGLIKGGVRHSDFMLFAFLNLFFTSLFSALIVTIIRKGEIKAGLKYIPIFIITSMTVFFLAVKVFSSAFGNLF